MSEDYWDNYETGPFCRHWSDPADCDIHCANCGHKCCQHDFNDGECLVDGCDCEGWKDGDESVI